MAKDFTLVLSKGFTDLVSSLDKNFAAVIKALRGIEARLMIIEERLPEKE